MQIFGQSRSKRRQVDDTIVTARGGGRSYGGSSLLGDVRKYVSAAQLGRQLRHDRHAGGRVERDRCSRRGARHGGLCNRRRGSGGKEQGREQRGKPETHRAVLSEGG